MMRARIFEGKKPTTVEIALEIAKQYLPVAESKPYHQGKDIELVCTRSLYLPSHGEPNAWMLVEDNSFQLVMSVGLLYNHADFKVSGSFVEGGKLIIESLDISMVLK